MFWIDGYADKYQVLNGFEADVQFPKEIKKAWLSMKPTTRAAYDLSMRENTIDGLITMEPEDLSKLKAGYIYSTKEDENNMYFIQTISKWETQIKSLNFNAIKCNCKVTIQRKGFEDDTSEESWIDIYKDVPASVSRTLSDSKNFNAGFENTTYAVVQMPIWEFVEDEEGNIVENFREVLPNDKVIITSNKSDELYYDIAVESVDNVGVSGQIKLQGTQDMRY